MGFTTFGGSGGDFSPNAFTTKFKNSAYTASSGERIISQGATITMPASPNKGDTIIVERVGSSSVEVQPNGTELIETRNEGYIKQDSTVGFISDGTNWYSIDGSNFLNAIPDSDLTQYTETDPDSVITVNSSTSFDVTGYDSNNSSRLSKQFSDLPNEMTVSVDVTVTSYSNGAINIIGFSDVADTTYGNLNNSAGWGIGSGGGSDTPFIGFVNDGTINSEIYTMGTNTQVTVNATYDFANDSFTIEVFEGGTVQESQTGSLNGGVTYDSHYAFNSRDEGVGVPGNMDAEFRNFGFSAP